MFRRLRVALSDAFGAEPSFHDLGRLTGQSRSTVQHWFQVYDHPHIGFLLGLLEQLPQTKRTELLSEFCRELPTVNHARLAHDPVAVAKLEALLQERHNLTVICGGTDFQRMFVLTAMGHSYKRLNGLSSVVAGMDIHEAKRLVPVPGVLYFKEPLPADQLRRLVNAAWSEITASQARLLLFDGLGAVLPAWRGKIMDLAAKRQVITADANGLDPAARSAKARTTVITLSQSKANPAWIQLEVVRL